MTIYFIYKTNFISGIGGNLPTNSNANLGLQTYDEWYFGSTEDSSVLQELFEFSPIVIEEDVYRGIAFVKYFEETGNKFKYKNPSNDPTVTPKERDLTTEEKTQAKKAWKFFEKLKLRESILGKIQDDKDMIADVSKRLEILESVVYKFVDTFANTTTWNDPKVNIPDSFSSEATLAQEYVKELDENRIIKSKKLNNIVQEFKRLRKRLNTVNTLLKTYEGKDLSNE